MKIALSQTILRRDDRAHNLDRILGSIKEAGKADCDLIIFGEAALCGFDAMIFEYEADLAHALSLDSSEINKIRKATREFRVAVGFGFYHKVDSIIYAAYVVINRQGETSALYHRMSTGWMIPEVLGDPRYGVGDEMTTFVLEDRTFTLMLCGDYWTDELVPKFIEAETESDAYLWPVHCDFTTEQWFGEHEEAYSKRSELLSKPIFFINNETKDEGRVAGGAYIWQAGETLAKRLPGETGLLTYEL